LKGVCLVIEDVGIPDKILEGLLLGFGVAGEGLEEIVEAESGGELEPVDLFLDVHIRDGLAVERGSLSGAAEAGASALGAIPVPDKGDDDDAGDGDEDALLVFAEDIDHGKNF